MKQFSPHVIINLSNEISIHKEIPIIELSKSNLINHLNDLLKRVINEMIDNNVKSKIIDLRQLFKGYYWNEEFNDSEIKEFLRNFYLSSKKWLTINLTNNENEFISNLSNERLIFEYKNHRGKRNYIIILQQIKNLGTFNLNVNDVNIDKIIDHLVFLKEKINKMMNFKKSDFNIKLNDDFILKYKNYEYVNFSKEIDNAFNNFNILTDASLFSLFFKFKEYEKDEDQVFYIKNIIWDNLQSRIKMDIYKETYLNIIFEDLYEFKVLLPLIKYLSNSLKENKHVILNYDLFEKYCINWNKLKDFNKNKISYVFSYKDNDFSNIFNNLKSLSRDDKEKIYIEGLNADGFLLNNLDGISKNESILGINIQAIDNDEVIYHELIHYLQFVSGQSIVRIASKRKNQIFKNINEDDKIQICEVLNINQNYFDSLYHSMLNQYEIIPHISNLFNELEEIFPKDLKRNVKILIKCLDEINKSNFKEYYKKVKERLKRFNILDKFEELSIISKLFLIMSFYFKISINTIKNHLNGYVNKE